MQPQRESGLHTTFTFTFTALQAAQAYLPAAHFFLYLPHLCADGGADVPQFRQYCLLSFCWLLELNQVVGFWGSARGRPALCEELHSREVCGRAGRRGEVHAARWSFQLMWGSSRMPWLGSGQGRMTL